MTDVSVCDSKSATSSCPPGTPIAEALLPDTHPRAIDTRPSDVYGIVMFSTVGGSMSHAFRTTDEYAFGVPGVPISYAIRLSISVASTE